MTLRVDPTGSPMLPTGAISDGWTESVTSAPAPTETRLQHLRFTCWNKLARLRGWAWWHGTFWELREIPEHDPIRRLPRSIWGMFFIGLLRRRRHPYRRRDIR